MDSPKRVIEGITLKFPAKLWRITNACSSGAIFWSEDGTSILIRREKFEPEFLNCESDFFKTENFNSFIRQLNIYGFKKKTNAVRLINGCSAGLYEYQHSYFKRDCPELLPKVERKGVNIDGKEKAILPKRTRRHSAKGFELDTGNHDRKNASPTTSKRTISHPLLATPVPRHRRPRPARWDQGGPTGTASDIQGISPESLNRQVTGLISGMDVIADTEGLAASSSGASQVQGSSLETSQPSISWSPSGGLYHHSNSENTQSLPASQLQQPIIFMPSLPADDSGLIHIPEDKTADTSVPMTTGVNLSSGSDVMNQRLDSIDNMLDCAIHFYGPGTSPVEADTTIMDKTISADNSYPQSGDCAHINMGGRQISGMFAPAYFDPASGTVTLFLPDNAGDQKS